MTVDGGVVALGSGLAVASCTALWKVSTLRSDLVANFGPRRSLAETGLDEKAARQLKVLMVQVTEVIGTLDKFDPTKVPGDPREIERSVGQVARLLAARRRVHRWFDWMLPVGPALIVLLLLFVPADLLAVSYFSGWRRARTVGLVGLWTSVVLVVLIAVIFIIHCVLMHLFSGAEVLAQPEDTNG